MDEGAFGCQKGLLDCEYFINNEQNCLVDFSKSGLKDPPSGESVNNYVTSSRTLPHIQSLIWDFYFQLRELFP
jgi:hypothetical protein